MYKYNFCSPQKFHLLSFPKAPKQSLHKNSLLEQSKKFISYNTSMDIYILDTNLFFNMQANLGLGETTEKIIITMTKAIQKAKVSSKAAFYMPPSIVEEIKSFFEDPQQEFLKEFFGEVIVKSPSVYNLNLSASLLGEIIHETRARAFKGMKVGEEEIVHAAEMFMGKETLGKKEFQMATGQIVTKYRERFRNATRTGFIDSIADFEIIMLANELNATLISTDEGVIYWGKKFGVKEMAPSVFGKKILSYV